MVPAKVVSLSDHTTTLPPLPEAARKALDTVERDRAYSRLRLDLL